MVGWVLRLVDEESWITNTAADADEGDELEDILMTFGNASVSIRHKNQAKEEDLS